MKEAVPVAAWKCASFWYIPLRVQILFLKAFNSFPTQSRLIGSTRSADSTRSRLIGFWEWAQLLSFLGCFKSKQRYYSSPTYLSTNILTYFTIISGSSSIFRYKQTDSKVANIEILRTFTTQNQNVKK